MKQKDKELDAQLTTATCCPIPVGSVAEPTISQPADLPAPCSCALVERREHTNPQAERQQLTTGHWQLTTAAKQPTLDSFLLNHFHLEGARALRFLIQHPDEEFTPLTLIQILSGTISYERYIPYDLMLKPPEERDTLQETSIPMTDEATLDAIKKRMDEIHAQKAKLHNRQPDCAELDAELDQLKKYLLECSRANGQLRSFNGVSRRPYQALCANINRVRKLLREHDPELDAYVARLLTTSPYFCWTCTGSS